MSDTYYEDHKEAADWARQMLASDALILDTETTGLRSHDQIVQLALIDMAGNVLLDCLIKPTIPISRDASAIHGITDAMVAEAPSFADIWPTLCDIIRDKTVIIYNADYDTRLLAQSSRAHDLPRTPITHATFKCAMLPYSAWVGDWSQWHGNYKFQKLPGGDHSALGDCKATLAVIKRMAEDKVAE